MDIGVGQQLNVDWLYMVRSGKAFTGYTNIGPSVGNVSEVQLFNPVGSGKTAIVYRFFSSASVAGIFNLSQFNTQFASLGMTGVNLQSGGPAAACQVRNATPVAQDGTIIDLYELLVNTTRTVVDDWYTILAAGQGLVASSQAVNLRLAGSFRWVEF